MRLTSATTVGGYNLVTWIRAFQRIPLTIGSISSIHITLHGIVHVIHAMDLSIIQQGNPPLWITTNSIMTIKLLGSIYNMINLVGMLLFARNAMRRLGHQEPQLLVSHLLFRLLCLLTSHPITILLHRLNEPSIYICHF